MYFMLTVRNISSKEQLQQVVIARPNGQHLERPVSDVTDYHAMAQAVNRRSHLGEPGVIPVQCT